jgi:3-hydroxyisobutyrate dehydrogenase-like beta-hydroxyacid dehydrogenase
MGLAMATNLQKHLATKSTLKSLLYANRTLSRGDPLKALGATPETNFPKLVAQCGIIFTMVCSLSALLN